MANRQGNFIKKVKNIANSNNKTRGEVCSAISDL